MDAYANALLIAIPGFLILILIEAIYGHFKGEQTMNAMDTISSLSSGFTNTLKDSLNLVVVILSYTALHKYIALQEMEDGWLVYVVGFIALDFASYWGHRLRHSVNVFWNSHVVHHSSEEFNLPCALRQSISSFIGIGIIFMIPAALLGVPPKVISILAPIHLFAQFWYHTRHIPKLGILEYIIVTPSQHRVHHAINPEYIDKNLAAIFCIWDRIFGTFQEELDDVPPVYGITVPAQTWNPIKINFQHLWLLTKDAWRTQSWWDKLRLWFMPTGWRPADMIEKYPIHKIEDPYNFEKYQPEASRGLVVWAWFQFLFANFLLFYMLMNFKDIGNQIPIYAILLFATIYGYTSLMDRERFAPILEVVRSAMGLGWIVYSGDWFGMNANLSGGTMLVAGYFVLSAVIPYFLSNETKPTSQLSAVKSE